MSRIQIALLALGVVVATEARASGGPFGLGVVLGEPTGITAKLWKGKSSALQFGLAYALDDYLLAYADYLMHFPGGFGHSQPFISQLNPYVGIGAIVFFFDRGGAGAGVRIPLGIEWRTPSTPIGIFIELVPGVQLMPSTDGFIEGGIGIRYYF